MKKGIQITIPTPCHENWDAMTPETQGRFCSSCSKTVIDFTNMTDSQILKTIENATDNICGRVQTTQLKRNLYLNESPRWQTPHFFKYAAAAIFMFKLSMPDVQAQKGKSIIKPRIESKYPKKKVMIATKKVISIERLTIMGDIDVTEPQTEQVEMIERYLIVLEKETGEIYKYPIVTTKEKDVIIEHFKPGHFKIISKSNVNPLIEVQANNRFPISIQITEETNIVTPYCDRNLSDATGMSFICKHEMNYFGKTNITIDLKEAVTKTTIKNATVKITKVGEEEKIVLNKTYTNSQLLLENIKGDGKFNVTISAPNYYDSSFIIDKNDYKKGNFTIPFFLKPNDDIVVIGYTNRKKKSSTIGCGFTTIGGLFIEGVMITSEKENAVAKLPLIQAKITAIEIFPTLTKQGELITIKLTTDNIEPMMLALISQDGKYLQTQKIQAMKGTQTFPFIIAQNIAPQMAFVKLMNAKGQWVVTEKLIIQ